MISNLNFLNKTNSVTQPAIMNSSHSLFHFVKSHTPSIIITAIEKIAQLIRSLFEKFFQIPQKSKSFLLQNKIKTLPEQIKESILSHRSHIKTITIPILLLGAIYAICKVFPSCFKFSSTNEAEQKDYCDFIPTHSSLKNSTLTPFAPFLLAPIVLTFLGYGYFRISGWRKNSSNKDNPTPKLNENLIRTENQTVKSNQDSYLIYNFLPLEPGNKKNFNTFSQNSHSPNSYNWKELYVHYTTNNLND